MTDKEKFERDFIIKFLKMFKGNVVKTTIHCNIPRKTMDNKLVRFKINPGDYK